eukprot:TRINITY_DN2825_c0_g1_i1.p1 TRINITY_DN2825_c0_g1~~TRINITY_DN2825_c0_g1_i1.p1  ORF type:complete len:457 (+),score=113.49 TRINITY_DN2825_c0_g1_i1:275-1645(+)
MEEFNTGEGYEWYGDFDSVAPGEESEFHTWALNFDPSNADNAEHIDLKLSGMLDIASELSQTLENNGESVQQYAPETSVDLLASNEFLQAFQQTNNNSSNNNASLNPLKTELTKASNTSDVLNIIPTTSLALTTESSKPVVTSNAPQSQPQQLFQPLQSLQQTPKVQLPILPQSQSAPIPTNANKDKKRRASTDNKSVKKTKSVLTTPLPEQPIAPRPASVPKKVQPTALPGQPLPYFTVGPTPKLLKPVQGTTTGGAAPIYAVPAATLANAEEQEKKINKLLDENANLINVIRENLMNGKMSDNVEPMNRFHKNIYTVLSWLSNMPGIMGEMPPLPVKLSTCLIPARSIAPAGAVASLGIAGYPGAVTLGAPIAMSNGAQLAQLENGQLVELVHVQAATPKMGNTSSSSSQTTSPLKSSTGKSTPIPVKPKPPNILPAQPKATSSTSNNSNFGVK